MLVLSFRPSDLYGGIAPSWTLSTWSQLFTPSLARLMGRTLWLASATTLICTLTSLPIGYTLARMQKEWRYRLLLAVMLPFWTSFIIRIFAWRTLLHPEGHLKEFLEFLHLMSSDQQLLYRPAAVLTVMVYTFLPVAILPIYAAAEKFDFRLIEAARDLGMGHLQAHLSIFIPAIQKGIFTASLLVFIPALGMYVIPDLIGGPESEILGNKIVQRIFFDRNLPEASALATLLFLTALLPIGCSQLIKKRRSNWGRS